MREYQIQLTALLGFLQMADVSAGDSGEINLMVSNCAHLDNILYI